MGLQHQPMALSFLSFGRQKLGDFDKRTSVVSRRPSENDAPLGIQFGNGMGVSDHCLAISPNVFFLPPLFLCRIFGALGLLFTMR